MKKLKISIVTPCYNEKGNIKKLAINVKKLMNQARQFEYEHIFIDNCSDDGTIEILENIAKFDKNIRVIFNEKNFGFSRSLFYGLTQASGDCAILLFADFQDPPNLIPKMINMWLQGAGIVVCIKVSSKHIISIKYIFY